MMSCDVDVISCQFVYVTLDNYSLFREEDNVFLNDPHSDKTASSFGHMLAKHIRNMSLPTFIRS